MRSLAIGLALASFAMLPLVTGTAARAQTAADIAAAVNTSCAVMSGAQKPDGHSLQLLLMLDEDMADANPVATALYRGVVHQCPKAYLAYEQRKRASNPFANHPLTSGTQTSLTSGSTSLTQAAPAVYPMRCVGTANMASAQAATLLVRFAKGARPATDGLQPGQCSWLDRGVAGNEPAEIAVPLASAAQAQNGVAQINAGGTWTFWVYNATTVLHATAVAKGTPAKMP